MDKETVIGVLGGMGPEATADCFEKLIRNTPAACDQEHLEIIVVNNPKVPDRTRAILENGTSPVATLHIRASFDISRTDSARILRLSLKFPILRQEKISDESSKSWKSSCARQLTWLKLSIYK